MLLTIDVGNTHTVLGVYEGEELLHMWRVQTDAQQTSDEARVALNGLFQMADIEARQISGIALATVVPSLNRLWHTVGETLCHCPVVSVDANVVADMIDTSGYGGTPGADRLADAVAARALYGSPAIVLDLGTATNIEVIDENGHFLGGAIAPGIQTSIEGLVNRTALLPDVELADPGCAIGNSTVKAIQIGVVYGQVDAIDGMVRRIWKQLGTETPVIATGGFGYLMSSLSQTVTDVNPELTLQGLRLIYQAKAAQ